MATLGAYLLVVFVVSVVLAWVVLPARAARASVAPAARRCRAGLTEGRPDDADQLRRAGLPGAGLPAGCLDSILGQPFGDIEVIGVDDCSPDASGDILAEYAARDPRVRVVRLPRTSASVRPATSGWTGPPASTSGSSTATTGWPRTAWPRSPTGCGPPARTCCSSTTSGPTGTTPPPAARCAEVFPEPPGAGTFRLRDRPEAMRLLHTAWNRLVRREFLRRPRAALRARLVRGRLVQLPGADGRRADRRAGPGLRQLPAAPRRRDHPDPGRPALRGLRRSGTGCSALMDAWGPASDALRAGGLRADDLALPDGARQRRPDRRRSCGRRSSRRSPPTTSAGCRPAAIRCRTGWRGSSTGWSPPAGGAPSARCGRPAGPATRPPAGRARPGAGSRPVGPARPPGWPGTRLLREYYRAELRRPLDPTLAVYAAYWYRGYACNPAAIYEEARRLAPQVRGVWVVAPGPGGHRAGRACEYVVAGTPAYYRALARARSWSTTSTSRTSSASGPAQVHVQTHHGTPLKMMGLDQQRYPVGAVRDGLRRAAAPGGPLGLQRHRQPLLHPDVGAGLPGRRTRRWRSATRATTGWSPADPDEVRRLRARARHRPRTSRWSSTPRRTASTCPATGRRSTWTGSLEALGPARPAADAQPLLLRPGPAPRPADGPGAGSSTSAAISGWRTSTWPPTCWSPTTRRPCSTTRCWTGRS